MVSTQLFQKKLRETAALVRRSRKIIVACHRNPDGDAIGSMLGLGIGLSKLDKSVVMLCPDKIPERYSTLPGVNAVKHKYNDTADLGISVDCGSLVQLARLQEAFEKSKRIVEIDHHAYRTRFGDIQLIDESRCSVGEIVYLLLKELTIPIDKRMAECLLISTLVETSSFSRHEIKTGTFNFCSDLMRSGLNYNDVSYRYYWKRKLSAVHLSGVCFTRIKSRSKDRLVWSFVCKKDYKKFQAKQEDVDAVADEMMMIENVEVALLFRETDDNMFRVSLRSKEGINVGSLATIYGGGGHRTLAGCRIHKNEKTLQKFISQACRLIEYKDSIVRS